MEKSMVYFRMEPNNGRAKWVCLYKPVYTAKDGTKYIKSNGLYYLLTKDRLFGNTPSQAEYVSCNALYPEEFNAIHNTKGGN
jgi:hypothetical protein